MFLKVTRDYGREFFLHFTEEKGIGCPWENWEVKLHVYGKRQTPVSSWELLKIENEQIKTAQNNSFW